MCNTFYFNRQNEEINYINSINIFENMKFGWKSDHLCVCLILLKTYFCKFTCSNIGPHDNMQPGVYAHRGRLLSKPLASSDSGSKHLIIVIRLHLSEQSIFWRLLENRWLATLLLLWMRFSQIHCSIPQ